MIRRPRLVTALLALSLLPALAACATAPGTGRTIFTGGMSADEEARIGFQEHQKIVPQFGGVYADPDLSAYVANIGTRLVRASETPNDAFTFTLLDTPTVNAFALPGGYVHITRGLVALADDEAELAGVLAHEIGHVTARHSAERYGQRVAATIANIGLGLVLGGGVLTDTFGQASAVALRSFSREQEFEADLIAVRYLVRAGYDPGAMADFLRKLQAHKRLRAELMGQPGKADEFHIMQTHPRTSDRIAQAIQQAGLRPVANPVVGRAAFLQRIDGLLYGDNPEQGLVRGRSFLHAKLRIAFEVPEGFRLFNGKSMVIARGPKGAAILFDRARKPSRASMPAYLTREWAREVRLQGVEAITINGLPAATGFTRLDSRKGPVELRLVAIRYDARSIYRMIFITPPRLTGALSRGLRETTYSFRALSPAEAARLKPLRVRLHRVRPGETAAKIAARMPFADYHLPRFLVLNGLSEGAPLPPGREVKVIAE